MTWDVITVSPHDRVSECVDLMTSHHIRHLVVVEEGVVTGMLSLRDLFNEIILLVRVGTPSRHGVGRRSIQRSRFLLVGDRHGCRIPGHQPDQADGRKGERHHIQPGADQWCSCGRLSYDCVSENVVPGLPTSSRWHRFIPPATLYLTSG